MGIVKWTEYEDKFKECETWLNAKEIKVQEYNQLQNTAEEKRAILEEFQAHLQNIFEWQKTLDLLNMRAQMLLETCSDSRVSNAVTQLTTKFNTLVSLAKEIMRRLEMHFQEHQQHNQLYAECHDWIENTREKLEECDTDTIQTSELQENLATVKSIKNSLELGQHKLRYVMELKERVIINTQTVGAQRIQKSDDQLRLQFEELISDIYSTQQEISESLLRSAETEKLCQDILEWMEEIDDKALGGGVLFGDLSEKRGALEKYRIIIRDIAVHHEMVDRLSSKKSDDQAYQAEVDSCVSKYKNLKLTVAKNIKILENYVKRHEIYHQASLDAAEWLRKTNLDVQECADAQGTKELTQVKLETQEGLKSKIAEGETIIGKVVDLSLKLMDTTSPEGKHILNAETDSLRLQWVDLQESNNAAIRLLSKCLKAWDDFNKHYEGVEKWVKHFQVRIENEPKDPTPADLEDWKVFIKTFKSFSTKL